jgi:hypothetical protein
MGDPEQKVIRLRRIVFDPQYSIFPSFHYSMDYLTAQTTPLG